MIAPAAGTGNRSYRPVAPLTAAGLSFDPARA